jgi:hypothetical protein
MARPRTERRRIRRAAARNARRTNSKVPKLRRWTGPTFRKFAFGIGGALFGWVLNQVGAPPEVVPIAAFISLVLIAWGVSDLEAVRNWLRPLPRGFRYSVFAVAALAIVGLAGLAWLMVGRSFKDVQFAGYPKFNDRQQVSAVAEGERCPDCQDEIDMDGIANLYVSKAGRGYVEVNLSDRPTVELNNPRAGTVPLPGNSEHQRQQGTPPANGTLSARGVAANRSDSDLPVSLSGSASSGQTVQRYPSMP